MNRPRVVTAGVVIAAALLVFTVAVTIGPLRTATSSPEPAAEEPIVADYDARDAGLYERLEAAGVFDPDPDGASEPTLNDLTIVIAEHPRQWRDPNEPGTLRWAVQTLLLTAALGALYRLLTRDTSTS